MKRILLLMLLGMFTTIAIAQTTWTGLGTNTNWNNTDNWDTNLIPTASDDVIIPTGFTVTLNTLGNIKSLDVQGTSVFEINSSLNFSENSSFGINTTVIWASGSINGAGNELNNLGTINLTTGANHTVTGATTIDNQGTLIITSAGDLFLSSASILNNPVGGVIEMQEDAGNITYSGTPGVINNAGLIKKTTSAGEAQIIAPLNNNDGTIQVEVGILSFQSTGKNFTDGTYNVFTGATMDWDTTINPSGSLSGSIAGNLNWNNTVNVVNGTFAAFNFSEDENFNWTSGTLNGGGTLTNTNVLKLTTGANHIVTGATTIDNQGTLVITSAGDLFLSGASILNNPVGGVIEMQEDAGNITYSGTPGVINNAGLIKKTTSAGEAQIITSLNNNDGTIQVEEGTLSFQSIAKNLTDGTYNVFAGATMDWDTTINPSGSLSGSIAGSLNWNNIVNVIDGTFAAFNFSEDENFNWTSGTLSGGGTLTNTNVLKLTTGANHTVTGATTIDNQGTLVITSAGDLFLSSASILNNPIGGVIEMQEDAGNITYSGTPGVINNAGLIKKTTSAGEARIITSLNNNDGTIQVEEGILSFQSTGKNFTDGTYNILAGATMDWDTTIYITGTLSGIVEGNLNWNNTVTVEIGETATFDFFSENNFYWTNGTLNGEGTLINSSNLNLSTGSNHSITDSITLINEGELNIISNGDLFLSQNSIIDNTLDGIIDMQANAGNITWSGAPGVINNTGLIKRTTSTGLVQIFVELNNSGIIEIISGELEFTGSSPFTNLETGIVKGIGIFDLPTVANYTNNGIVAPGLSLGTLNVQGDYESTSTSVLEIELNGLTPDADHDVLAITGNNNVFEGSVNVIMGFEGTIGDEFTIATTTGTIATANLQSPIENVDFDGKRYTFDVSYPDNNKVVLTITDKLDILPPNIITQDITVQLDASGNVSIADTDVDNGTTDNCTPTNELQFSLDITDFTCIDLGDNIVTLTVTDNDGNFSDAQAIVTVEDVTNPTAVTQGIAVQLDASGTASILASEVDNGSSDNCMIASLSLDVSDFTCADLGNNTVNLTVEDQSGNSATETATVTVEDVINPTVVTQDITVSLDASGNASISAGDVNNGSSDNCSVVDLSLNITDFTCSDLGDNTVILTVLDQSGNSASETATVTVEDDIDPTAITQDITVQLDASGTALISVGDIDNGSSDNCSVVDLSLDISDFSCSDIGDNTVKLTVIDGSGNMASETAIVTVVDDIDPIIVCPSGFTVETVGDFTLPDYVDEGTVAVSDNCEFTVVQTPAPGTILPDGEYEISYVITDDFGNSASCFFNLKVDDTTLNINDFELSDNTIVLFPNPVENVLNIKNNSQLDLVNLEIYDVTGKLVNTLDLKSMNDTIQISLQNYANGVYFVRINAENSSIIKRIIRQ